MSYPYIHPMRKQILYTCLAVPILWGCGGGDPALDIETSDLKAPCDCVSALQAIYDALDELKADHGDTPANDIPEDAEDRFLKLSRKLEAVEAHCYSHFDDTAIRECKGYDKLRNR